MKSSPEPSLELRIQPHTVRQFQDEIFAWWQNHKRDLPWRHTRDPYKIFISEIMLQQTQVDRVISKYLEFIKLFPSVYALAEAPTEKILILWKGLGYNRRALYLKKTAQAVVQQYNGSFPPNISQLSQLPGIGPYTASAICVFAYEQNEVVIDTNVRRVLDYFMNEYNERKKQIHEPKVSYESVKKNGMTHRMQQHIARQLLPTGKSWDWHQALMDYSALVLPKKKRPKLSVKFSHTPRFFRGQIMNDLRTGKKPLTDIQKKFAVWQKEISQHYNFHSIIQKMEHEGLLTCKKVGKTEYLELPQD